MSTKAAPKGRARSLVPPFQTILVPTDVSENGNLAAPLAYHLAGNGSTVHLLHVCQPPFYGNAMYGTYVQGYVPTPEDIEHGRSKIRKSLQHMVPKSAISDGVRTEFHLVDGVSASRCISEQAKAINADVVVMSTHGYSGLKRILMGSVASDVMKHKDLSVVLVHQDQHQT